MINKVRATINDKSLITSGDKVLVALSGGADSVTLLSVLLKLSKEMNFSLCVAHVNHNIRGDEALRDEKFVRDLCDRLGVELFVKSVDIPKLSKERGESEELCGRNVRYEFFSELSKELAAKVATAHTLSDSEETMLYNIARGTSLHGLCSIPYKREEVIRPLLDVTREEIEEYIKENKLNFVEDSTNSNEDICRRNKIRHSVLPPLKKVNDGFHRNFLRLRQSLGEINSYMDEKALEALSKAKVSFGYSCEELQNNHSAVLSVALSQLLKMWGVEPQSHLLELIKQILSNGGAVPLKKGKIAVCKQGVLRLSVESSEEFSETKLCEGLEFTAFQKYYSIKEINTEEINKKFADYYIDCDKISADTVIRVRKDGDMFTLCRRNITKPLRKLQNELKIPAEKRDTSLVIADGSCVLWAEHIGVSKQGSVSYNTKKAICIAVKEGE